MSRIHLALALLLLAGSAEAGDALHGQVVDRRGRPVACEGAVLVELEAVVSCDDEGRFALPLPAERPGELSLVVYAPGYRDAQLVVDGAGPVTVTLRRGRSRRAQSTTFGGGWRSLDRTPPAVDESLDLGSSTLTPGDHALSGGGYGDVNRSLQSLPGVTGDTAASAQLRIRGGEPHETLMFVDGIRLREPTHLGGLFGAFDPDLAERVTVATAAPSAALPESLGGAVDVEYVDRPRDRVDGAIDLSFLAAGAHLAVALDKKPKPRASLVLGARRSLLQAYLGAFQAAGAVDIPLRTVDYGSYMGRLTLEPTDTQSLRFTVLHLHDRALFDDVNSRHRAVGGSVDWVARPGPRTSISTLFAWRWEELAEPDTDFEYPGKRTWTDDEQRGRLKVQVDHGFGDAHALRFGIDGGLVFAETTGVLLDTRSLPPWAALPNADLLIPSAVAPGARQHGELDLFGEVELRDLGDVLDLRAGLRGTILDASLTPHLSPRLAVALRPASGTVVRGSVALVHQARSDTYVTIVGDPAQLRPERAVIGQLGFGQTLGPVGVIELMGWVRGMDNLVVPWMPRLGQIDFEGSLANHGRGLSGGADVSWRWAPGRFELGAAYSLLVARRWNDQEEGISGSVPAAGDQRHQVRADARVFLGRQRGFVIGLGWTSKSGWPSSTLTPLHSGDRWLWQVTGLNDRRLPDVHRVDLRIEHRIPTRRVRIRGSFELNADLGGRVFLENCPSDAPADAPPECTALTFWPAVRPWLGLKVEW